MVYTDKLRKGFEKSYKDLWNKVGRSFGVYGLGLEGEDIEEALKDSENRSDA
ncbi:MAG: hypothetical protein ACLFQ8_02470 [Candidatus Aenigmatarchaeota archaeon]